MLALMSLIKETLVYAEVIFQAKYRYFLDLDVYFLERPYNLCFDYTTTLRICLLLSAQHDFAFIEKTRGFEFSQRYWLEQIVDGRRDQESRILFSSLVNQTRKQQVHNGKRCDGT